MIMRRILIFLFLVSSLSLTAQEIIKVGSYNVAESDARMRQVNKGNFTPQRYYCNSAGALAKMIADIDCDVIGLQEVCDSMWVQAGSGNIDLRKKVAEERGDVDYDWVLFPNTASGKISYDSAIGYKKSRFKKMSSGIFWMTEIPDVAKSVPGAPKGSARPAVWAKFKSKKTGQIFYFYSTHLVLGSMHKDGGNEYNATHFMRVAQDRFEPKYPSFVVGDFNCAVGSESFNIMTGGRWTDTFEYMKEKGMELLENGLLYGTMAKNKEDGWGKGVIDHIMFYKAEPLKYWVDRRMFPTADGTMHYPSDHLPIIAEFKL
jgi:endonuclease/exonuclease/phosphatase family metal-dependent hydrolase